MLYYNPNYDILAQLHFKSGIKLLWINESEIGSMVFTSDWELIGEL